MKTTDTTTTSYYVIEEKTIFDDHGNPSIPVYYVAPEPEATGDRIVAGPFQTYTEALENGLEKTWNS